MFYGKEFFSDQSGIEYRRLVSCLKAANTEDAEQECVSISGKLFYLPYCTQKGQNCMHAILAFLSAIGLNREDWSSYAEAQPNFTVNSEWHSYSCDVVHLSALRIVFC